MRFSKYQNQSKIPFHFCFHWLYQYGTTQLKSIFIWSHFGWLTVWPDAEIKSSPKFSKSWPKPCQSSFFYLTRDVFLNRQKSLYIYATFEAKYFTDNFEKIAQFGHTGDLLLCRNLAQHFPLLCHLPSKGFWLVGIWCTKVPKKLQIIEYEKQRSQVSVIFLSTELHVFTVDGISYRIIKWID